MKRILTLTLLLALLSGPVAFAGTPIAKEFTSGNRTKFSTAGHPKSKGLDMVLSYPNSWSAQEGERPNIVQKFFSEGGRGLEGALIITKNLPLPPGTVISEDELKELFAPAEMKAMLPRGANFIQARRTKIEGIPAGVLEYSMRQERAGLTFDSQFISYMFIYGTTLVQLQCMVTAGQPTSSVVLARKMDDFKPLFFLMANSIVLRDKWK